MLSYLVVGMDEVTCQQSQNSVQARNSRTSKTRTDSDRDFTTEPFNLNGPCIPVSSSGNWSKLGDLQQPRHGHSAITNGKTVLVIGGSGKL